MKNEETEKPHFNGVFSCLFLGILQGFYQELIQRNVVRGRNDISFVWKSIDVNSKFLQRIGGKLQLISCYLQLYLKINMLYNMHI